MSRAVEQAFEYSTSEYNLASRSLHCPGRDRPQYGMGSDFCPFITRRIVSHLTRNRRCSSCSAFH